MARKLTPLPVEFRFAGFGWPRYIVDCPNGPADIRRRSKLRERCGPGYRSPGPNNRNGWGFYLGTSNDLFELREECRTGSYTYNEFGDSIDGIVFRLPKNRGFVAGYTMGDGMASAIDAAVWTDLDDAKRAADSEAERMADEQAEFELAERERMEAEESEFEALGTDE